MPVLILPVKREYFEQIRDGKKDEEYRLYNEYWKKRILGKTFTGFIVTLGYPKHDDESRKIGRCWKGYEIKTITHKHFGEKPVKVFAIKM